MTQALLISNVILWVLVVGLALLVVALTRQVGLIHERVAPVGALAHQRTPEVGEAAPDVGLVDLDGQDVAISGAGARTLIFFLSPSCPVCKTILPTVRRVVADEVPATRLIFASDGDPADHLAFRRKHGLEKEAYVLSTELGVRLGVAKLPTAVLVDEHGIVRARGLVNTREHLESLFEADERSVGSLQEFVARERGIKPLPTVEAQS